MKTKLINYASDFLGANETRYFSNGYKYICYSFIQTVINNNTLKSTLKIDLNKNHSLSIKHLGAIEYIAIACNLCKQLIRKEYHLTNKEIAKSWICSCHMKIKRPIIIDKNKMIEIYAKVINTYPSKTSINGHISSLKIHIGDAIISLEVDHPIKSWFRFFPFKQNGENSPNLYIEGYKQREHQLTDIYVYPEIMKCNASVKVIEKHTYNNGIGAKYNTILLPDIINISGQLSQILLYTLEDIARKDANNMWLREFSINCPKPFEKLDFKTDIIFNRFEQLQIHNETWRSVYLTTYSREIKANFKITHKIHTGK